MSPRWEKARGELLERTRDDIELLSEVRLDQKKYLKGQIEKKRQEVMVMKAKQCQQIRMRNSQRRFASAQED